MANQVTRRPLRQRFLGNRNHLEVHDLLAETPNCRIDEIIRAGHAVVFDPDTLEEAHREGYDKLRMVPRWVHTMKGGEMPGETTREQPRRLWHLHFSRLSSWTLRVVGLAIGWTAALPVAAALGAPTSTPGATPGSTPGPTPSSGPILDVGGGSAVVLIALIGAAIALLWIVPMMVDTLKSHRALRRFSESLMQEVIEEARRTKGQMSVDKLREVLKLLDHGPTGMRGLARALMAFAIITIVAVALVAVLVSGAADASDLRKTIIASLLSVLATIIGFYFGTRASETATETASSAPVVGESGGGRNSGSAPDARAGEPGTGTLDEDEPTGPTSEGSAQISPSDLPPESGAAMSGEPANG
ncbi:MAG: hypothetical protein ACJ77A_14935 [Actinomycetota bacterium]